MVTSLKSYAFSNSPWMHSLTIPTTITSIGGYCFWRCCNLSSVTFIPGSQLKAFPYKLFDLTVITQLEIPESVVKFKGYSLFNNLYLVNLTYCGNAFIDENVIKYSNSMKAFVTPKYNFSTLNGITPIVRYDHICPTIIYINKFKYRCSMICKHSNILVNMIIVLIYK